MKKILKDFDKLLATINNVNNNFFHYKSIRNMVYNFEDKYSLTHKDEVEYMVKYLHYKIDCNLMKGINIDETQH